MTTSSISVRSVLQPRGFKKSQVRRTVTTARIRSLEFFGEKGRSTLTDVLSWASGLCYGFLMAARSIGTATISFGLVSVPVKLYSASETSSGVSFHMLHAKDNTRLKQQYICPSDGEIVPRDQMVKGYEFSKDQYVTFTDEEIKSAGEEATRAIEITEFVPISKVDPIYFEGGYYLGPDKGGDRGYALLAEAMRKTGRCALAKWAARGKGYLVLVRPVDDGLVMQQLHYADEIKKMSDVGIETTKVKESELGLAIQLVEQIASDEFHPEHYEDEVRKRLQVAIQQKVEGQEVTAVAPEQPRAQIIDLMEALKASLAKKAATKAAEAEAKPARALKAVEKPAKRHAAGGRKG
jgi:DNA end-binding protein Ku